jgi:hypothetical protein
MDLIPFFCRYDLQKIFSCFECNFSKPLEYISLDRENVAQVVLFDFKCLEHCIFEITWHMS